MGVNLLRKIWNQSSSIVSIIIGILLETAGLKCFLTPFGIIEGGATGISLLLNTVTGVDVSIFLVVVNLPFILMAIRQMGWRFAITVAISIVLLSVSMYFIPFPTDLLNPDVNPSDKLLAAIFGGIFVGAGTGFAIRGGAAIDGSEVLGIFVSRFGFMSVGSFIALFNVLLFIVAAFIIGPANAFYSILTYFAASKSIDFVVSGIEEYIGITVISPKHRDIRHKITDELGYGVTLYRAGGGYAGAHDQDRKIIYCVVTRLEVARILGAIQSIDPNAFIVQSPVRDIRGGVLKRRSKA